MLRSYLLLLTFTFVFSTSLLGQFSDDFSDGDFTTSPTWNGETGFFIINGANELQSNGPASTDTIHLYTTNSVLDSAEWEFWVNLNFQPSTSNFLRVYLASDQTNLEGSLDGYYLEIGESGSNDSIRFYRQDGSTSTLLATGTKSCFDASSNNTVRFYVFRTPAGQWEISTDCAGGTTFSPEIVVTDASHTTTTYFGVYCRHTSTRADKFHFDDFHVGGYRLDTFPPVTDSLKVLSSTQLDVYFDQPVELLTAQAPANYSVDGGIGPPASALRDGTDSALVHLTFSSPFINGTNYNLTVQNVEDNAGNPMSAPAILPFYFFIPDTATFGEVVINEVLPDPTPVLALAGEYVELYNNSSKTFDLAGWEFSDATSSITLGSHILTPNSYLILCDAADSSIYALFGDVLVTNIPSLNNTSDQLTISNDLGTVIDSVTYSDTWYKDAVKADGGWSLELINPNSSCDLYGNWIASTDIDGGTPGTENSVFDTLPDLTPPTIASLVISDSNKIEICFNEAIDLTALTTSGNYSVDLGIGSPTLVTVLDSYNYCAELTFSTSFAPGSTYTISITGMQDCKGNAVSGSLTESFSIGGPGARNEVIFTELFADPSPQVGLPEAEFIEIHNRSTKLINLDSWVLRDGTGSVTLPSENIAPGEYIILCHTSDTSDFSPFGRVIGLSGFISLANAGEAIALFDSSANLIDLVNYDDSWYRDDLKADGGWSLERVDREFLCQSNVNWIASTNSSGGTPGSVNSIDGTTADTDRPTVERVTILSPSSIEAFFSEAMDSVSMAIPANYSIDNGIGSPAMVILRPPFYTSAELLLPTTLDTNITYTVTVSGLTDCPGNAITSPDYASFGIPLPIEPGDLIINEILFNPYSGGSDYVELYNLSDKVVDLSTLYIAEYDEEYDSLYNADKVSEESHLLLPQQYICLTPDKAFQISTYQPEDPTRILEMASFPSYDDAEGICSIFVGADTVIDQFHYLDDYHFPNLDDDDGVSLERLSFSNTTDDPDNWHSAASTVLYGTPGYKNSQGVSDGTPSPVSVSPETFSPDQDGFDDILTIHYHFPEAGTNARVRIFDDKGRLIRKLKENTLLSTEPGTFTWDGTTDNDQKADIGIYVILFETSNPNTGKKKAYKAGCVLAAKL